MARKKGETEGQAHPSVEYITELRDCLRADEGWTKQHEKNEKMHALYHNEHEVESVERSAEMLVDPTKHVTRLGTARDAVDRMTGLKLAYPRHSIAALGIGSSRQEHAEMLEKWQDAAGPQIEYEQGEDTNFLVTSEVDLYGYSAVKVFPDPARWKDYPKWRKDQGQKAGEYTEAVGAFMDSAPMPFVEWHMPARTMFLNLDGRVVVEAVECRKLRKSVLKSRYGYEWKEGKGTDEIDVVDFIDDTWCVSVGYETTSGATGGGDVLKAWKHDMPTEPGHAPVVLYEGIMAADRRPGYRWSSFLERIYDALVTRDMVVTRQRVMVAAWYLVTFIEEVQKAALLDPTANAEVDRDFLLGAANRFPEGTTLKQMPWPDALPDAELLWAKVQAEVDSALPEVLRGVIPGETSGYLFNLATEHALAGHKAVSDRIARADAERARLRFLAVAALGKKMGSEDVKVTVIYQQPKGADRLAVSWEDVKDYGNMVRCRRDRQLVTDKLANLEAAEKAVGFGFSRQTAAEEYIGTEDWATEKIQRMGEDIEDSEPFVQERMAEVARRLQVLRDQEEGMTPEEMTELAPQMPAGLAAALGVTPPAPVTPPGGVPVAPTVGPGGPVAPSLGMSGEMSPEEAPAGPGGGGGPSVNPRAGQRTRPSGPRRKARSRQMKGDSR